MKSVTGMTANREKEVEKMEDEVPVGTLNYDGEEDPDIAELVSHTFVAPEEENEVSKAKDANLREESEDWYDITDPRNKMNQRRRAVQ
ncbi:unnamed protein product [Gongylonema pulchrum]|uniref:Uncharacterized protein n=1 Tax=Gongylonema pulchrum TaxID=637853 RepID=A0A183D2G2_9BILA|nr:unnamed protein product [Gongylonema pulchrum]